MGDNAFETRTFDSDVMDNKQVTLELDELATEDDQVAHQQNELTGAGSNLQEMRLIFDQLRDELNDLTSILRSRNSGTIGIAETTVNEDMLNDPLKSSCSICLDEYSMGQSVGSSDCDHCFHISCIEKWLVDNDSCPYCRKCLI